MAANNQPTAFDKEQIFGMAEKEMEYRVELFNKLTQTCFNKCTENRYKESELNMGENSCIDRCVSKYWQGTKPGTILLGSKSIDKELKVCEISVAAKYQMGENVTNLVGQLLGSNRPPL